MYTFDPTNLTDLNVQLGELDGTLQLVAIRNIYVASGIRKTLPSVLDKKRKIMLVMDDTPIYAGKSEIKQEIKTMLNDKNFDVTSLVYHHDNAPDGMVHADWKTVERLQGKLDEKTIVVSIGSGTITDIAKHATYRYAQESNVKIPLIVVQTANTVTAYTSNIAVLLKDGVKRTYPSRYPDYVISDIDIIKQAPFELTQAGFGDLMARYVSYADWYLGYKCKNLSKYTEVPKMLLDDMLEYLVHNASGLKKGNVETYTVLTKALLNAGISMSIVGMSTPISGFEHVMSHTLDMVRAIQHKKPLLHGTQVAIATVFAAYAYEELLSYKEPFLRSSITFPDRKKIEKTMRDDFKQQGFSSNAIKEMLNDYRIKHERWVDAERTIHEFIKLWDVEKKKLQSLVKKGDEIKQALDDIGLDYTIPDDMEFAFTHAHFIRKRFTSADLFFFLNKLNSGLYKRVLERVVGE
ncbi:iron-containing alcohol dehydrogenase [Candidatus Peregrinibacteria bacterium]|nr:iron-containing alcohol dehydrogenase [Candidatus Peregrinibacteria bacterium]